VFAWRRIMPALSTARLWRLTDRLMMAGPHPTTSGYGCAMMAADADGASVSVSQVVREVVERQVVHGTI